MSDTPMFDFDLRIVQKDSTGYYAVRWDSAQKITVRAATRHEATNKAAAAMGQPSRGRDWRWTTICDDIREVHAETMRLTLGITGPPIGTATIQPDGTVDLTVTDPAILARLFPQESALSVSIDGQDL